MRRSAWAVGLVLVALWLSQLLGGWRVLAVSGQPTDAEWAKTLAQNGFGGDQQKLLTALEVLFAESGGDCTATNPSGARGCWQFMARTLPDDTCARDPVCSTKKAAEVSRQGADWSKWQAYTSGDYKSQAIQARARAAVSQAAPGCNWVTDTVCFLQLLGQPVHLGLPSLDAASPLDLLKMIPADQAGRWAGIAMSALLGAADNAIFVSFEPVWAVMLSGEDNIGGQERWGGVLLLDSSPVERVWAFSATLFTGSLAVLLLSLGIVYRMLRGSYHEFFRDLVYLVAGVILIAGSFFLISELIAVSNAVTAAIAGQTSFELRSLSVYQHLGARDPNLLTAAGDWATALIETVAAGVVAVEILLLFFVYLVRAAAIWALVVFAPPAIAAGFFAPGRKITVFWLELLLAVIVIKPINALLFMLFLVVGVEAQGILNALLLIGFLWLMWKVPKELMAAVRSPGLTESARDTGHAAVTYQPLRLATGLAWSKVKGRIGGA